MVKAKTVRFDPAAIVADDLKIARGGNKRAKCKANKRNTAPVTKMPNAIAELIDCGDKEASSEDDESSSYAVNKDLFIKFTETRNIICHVYTVHSSAWERRFTRKHYQQLAEGILSSTLHASGLCVMVTPPPRNAQADVMCVIYLCVVNGSVPHGRITKRAAVRAGLFSQNPEDVMYHKNLSIFRRCYPPSEIIPNVQVLYTPMMWHMLFNLHPNYDADTVCCGAMTDYFMQVLEMPIGKKSDLWNSVFSEFMPKIHDLCVTTKELEASDVKTIEQ